MGLSTIISQMLSIVLRARLIHESFRIWVKLYLSISWRGRLVFILYIILTASQYLGTSTLGVY